MMLQEPMEFPLDIKLLRNKGKNNIGSLFWLNNHKNQ